VIIVGGGGSGLATAVSAAEHGASVLVLEKQPEPGGTTGMSIGSYTACCTRQQAKAGVVDRVNDHAEDIAKFAAPEVEARDNHELRRFFLRHNAETLHWLMGMGLRFYGPSPEPPNRVPRMHNVVPRSKAYITTLQARARRAGGVILCNASVTELVTTGLRVTGVIANVNGVATEYTARRGVALAHQLLRRKHEVLASLAAGDADVAWRAAAMRPHVPRTGPIPFLVARPGVHPSHACGSCGDPLPHPTRLRCRPCSLAAWRVIHQVREGLAVPVPPSRGRQST